MNITNIPDDQIADERERPAAPDVAKHRKKLGDRERFNTFDRPSTERSYRAQKRSSSRRDRASDDGGDGLSALQLAGSWAVFLVSALAILYWIVVLLIPK
jgi:uncharacterized membrane protein